jgi:F-type H+-transporting ATPase subunit b
MRPGFRLAAALLLCAAPCILPAQARAEAQPPAARAVQQVPAPNGNGTFISQKTATTQNLARAEQEDEEYVFKHSASVRTVGKWLHLSPDQASMVFWGLNFLILAGVLGYALLKGLPKAFRNRRQLIEKQLVEARAATEQANLRLRSVEERLARLDTEIAGIRDAAERETARDEQRMKAAMEEERRKIVIAAEQEIDSAGAAAERRLRQFAAKLAVERAEARMHLTEADDRALIRDFAAQVGRNGGTGGRR